MTMKNQVHVVDSEGNLLFTRLLDDGSNVLCFKSGFGHLTQDMIRSKNWEIRDGWPRPSHRQGNVRWLGYYEEVK